MTGNGEEKPTFGSRLKEKRLAKGWSQHYLAARASCTNSNISYLESHPNQKPKIETVESLAAALDWPVQEARRLAGYPESDDNLSPGEIERNFGAALHSYKELSGHGRELVKKQIRRIIGFVSECERGAEQAAGGGAPGTAPAEPDKRMPGGKKKRKKK